MSDEPLAKELGIDKGEAGDIFMLRKSSAFTRGIKPNLKIQGYDYNVQKVLTKEDMEHPE